MLEGRGAKHTSGHSRFKRRRGQKHEDQAYEQAIKTPLVVLGRAKVKKGKDGGTEREPGYVDLNRALISPWSWPGARNRAEAMGLVLRADSQGWC